MTLAKFLDDCYMFCDLCILMHVNLIKTCFLRVKPACACSNMHKLLAYSAAAERVFSLLSNSFKENQQNALEDYISTSVMLQYNSK